MPNGRHRAQVAASWLTRLPDDIAQVLAASRSK